MAAVVLSNSCLNCSWCAVNLSFWSGTKPNHIFMQLNGGGFCVDAVGIVDGLSGCSHCVHASDVGRCASVCLWQWFSVGYPG